jgi:predicted esterase
MLLAGLAVVACGGDDGDSESETTTGGAGGAAGSSSGGSAGTASGGAPSGSRCGSAPPAGAPTAAAPKAFSGGTCPALTVYDGTPATANTIATAGGNRQFLLVAPDNITPDEKLPLIFLWHWLGGDANGFYERAEIKNATTQQRFIAVIPEKKGDLLFVWPGDLLANTARTEEELAFFDDMLACVSQSYNVDNNCVSSAGVSAGALWTPQLASARGEYISSFISLSGGTGGVIKPWGNPQHKMPALVLWGGPDDNCAGLLSFEQASGNLEDALVAGGHFFLECIHNCGHSQPPFEGPPGFTKFKGMWDFFLDHPYWLGPGESPYNATGVPDALPDWCGIGKGSATPKTGECIDASEC